MNAPLRLAIVDDYAVVIAGVASFLSAERIEVVETGASKPVISDVDIVLYDTFAQVDGDGIDLEDFVRDSGAKVVIYSWNLQPKLIEQAIAGGASGYLSKVLTGPEIVAALERVMRGEIVILPGDSETSVDGAGDWPGRSAGLTPREAEILALITQGLSNQEICDTCVSEHQLGEDLHPHRLPQDQRHVALASGAVGRGQRLQARHAAHHRPGAPTAATPRHPAGWCASEVVDPADPVGEDPPGGRIHDAGLGQHARVPPAGPS